MADYIYAIYGRAGAGMKRTKEKTHSLLDKLSPVWQTIKSDYRHWICIGITLCFLLLAVFVFPHAFGRIIESCIDIGTSSKYYVSELFELNLKGEITVNEFSKLPFKMPFKLPNTWEEFQVAWGKYWELLFTQENFTAYLEKCADVLFYVSKGLIILLPIVSVAIVFATLKKSKPNNDYNKDSRFLHWWKEKFEKKVYVPVKKWLRGFVGFVKENVFYIKLWAFIWTYSFNGIAIVCECLAFYLYFVASFKMSDVYVQVLKLLIDLSVCIDFIPVLGWIVLGFLALNVIRRKIGYDRLEHMERMNRGFINERPIVTMINGTMGTGKTTMITDMALSQEIMFRNEAFDRMMKADLKFPFFPWINLELSIKYAMKRHTVYSLATMRKFIRARRRYFEKHKAQRNIFGYDYERYGMEFDNKLYLENVWEVIETYAQLYLIYVTQSSLIVSNYSIRSDITLADNGNLPLWNTELFRIDSSMLDKYSKYAHILDFDMLRLGKKVVERNKKADSFEFGIIVITEIGKERGNNLENQEMKKKDDSANAKNDLFNDWLKMVRHNATVDNFPFVKVIVDEQRPESWGADARDLCEIGIIEERTSRKLAMPLFALGDLLIEWKLGKGVMPYAQHRFERGDNIAPVYFSHGLNAKLFKYHLGIYNTFGYDKLKLSVEKGTRDGKVKLHTYYLMDSKIRRKRFSTDCFSEVFEEKALRSELGLDDLECYVTSKAKFFEMLKSNSYFFKKLANIKDGNEQEQHEQVEMVDDNQIEFWGVHDFDEETPKKKKSA